jgi:hypothetical protein
MKFFLHMRRKEGSSDINDAWISFAMCWRTVGWKIWGLREIGSLGKTIIIRLKATSGSD